MRSPVSDAHHGLHVSQAASPEAEQERQVFFRDRAQLIGLLDDLQKPELPHGGRSVLRCSLLGIGRGLPQVWQGLQRADRTAPVVERDGLLWVHTNVNGTLKFEDPAGSEQALDLALHDVRRHR